MKLFSTRFCAAMPRNSASAWASPSTAGRRIAAARAIDAGTIASTSARREPAPIAFSMVASASVSMPTWRATNSDGFSSSASGFSADMSMADVPVSVQMRRAGRVSGVLDQFVVGSLVHQRIGLGRSADLDLEEPARSLRVAVGERRVGTQRLVDLDDLAADRHVQIGGGLH